MKFAGASTLIWTHRIAILSVAWRNISPHASCQGGGAPDVRMRRHEYAVCNDLPMICVASLLGNAIPK
jgi:hypothetical protein